MKKILVLCASVLVVGGAYLGWHFSRPEHYGNPFTWAPLVGIDKLPGRSGSEDVRVEGRIIRQCPVTGCWFYLDDGKGHQTRVELGNVVPKLPQRIGRRAVVQGRLVSTGEELVFSGSGVEFR